MAKRVTTNEFRVSFPQVFEPKAFEEGGKANYSIQMVFDKKTDLKALHDLIQEAAVAKWGDKMPKKLTTPFRDGDEEKDGAGAYKNAIFCNASSQFQPQIVDGALNPILDRNDFYAGCYARASVNAYAYDYMGNKGVSLGLGNIQKLRDGERLDGAVSAENEFSAVVQANSNSGEFTL
jgi:hypothetical protein